LAKIRILIADDHAVLRAGLRVLINSEPDMGVVGEAADVPDTVRKAAALRPDVALVDLTMPGGNVLEALERIRRDSPRTRVLVLTVHDDPAYARAVLAAGGSGHVVKEVEIAELLSALRAIHRGRTLVNLGHGGSTPGLVAETGPARRRGAPRFLSRREREVLELVAQGHTNQEVADRLSLSVKTVETHRARLVEKLGLRTRADLVRFALETGVLRSGKNIRRHKR
jgi:DNA-binding NarL/FixJ family response regulator